MDGNVLMIRYHSSPLAGVYIKANNPLYLFGILCCDRGLIGGYIFFFYNNSHEDTAARMIMIAIYDEKGQIFHDKLTKEKTRSYTHYIGLYPTVPYLRHQSSDGSRSNTGRHDGEEVNDPPLGRGGGQAEREQLQENDERHPSSH